MAGDANIKRSSAGATEWNISSSVWAGVEVSDMKTFLRLAGEYRQYVDEAQQQINALVERNKELKKKLAAHAEKDAQLRHFVNKD